MVLPITTKFLLFFSERIHDQTPYINSMPMRVGGRCYGMLEDGAKQVKIQSSSMCTGGRRPIPLGIIILTKRMTWLEMHID